MLEPTATKIASQDQNIGEFKHLSKLKVNTTIKNVQNNKLKSRALKPSTNIIKSSQPNTNHPLKPNLVKSTNESPPVKPKANKSQNKVQSDLKKAISDENDEAAIPIPDDYITEYSGFDEELYRKIRSLELADDGLPMLKSTEPFDF